MKNLLLIVLLLISASPISALAAPEIHKGKAKLTSTDFLTKKQMANLVGTWVLEPDEEFLSSTSIAIEKVNPGVISKGLHTVSFKVLAENGSPSTGALLGYSLGKVVFLTIPFVGGYRNIAMTVNKKAKSASYIDMYTNYGDCDFADSTDPDSGLNIFNCTFPDAEISFATSGSASN